MTSNQCYGKKASIVQWRNGSGSDSTNALPTSIAVIPSSIMANHTHHYSSNNGHTLSINGKSPINSHYGKSRIRPPSLVWEGVAGHLKGGVTAPTSPRVTAMGVATTVNATAEAIFSQQIAGSLSNSTSQVNCRSDGATPTPTTPTSDVSEFILHSGKAKLVNSSSYQPHSLSREDSILNSLECWDYSVELECLQGPDDLQLAAELGKTLLERNKELENSLKEQQAIIDDQAQEIEYLTKQTTTLREINDSRVKIYEQLEVSIADLEATNKQLVEESKADKHRIKSLCVNINRLDARCEDLQRCLDEARLKVETAERKNKATNRNIAIDLEKKLSNSEIAALKMNASFVCEGNNNSDLVTYGDTSNHYSNISESSGNDVSETRLEDINGRPNGDLNHHSCGNDSQEYNDHVPSITTNELQSKTSTGAPKHRHWNTNSMHSTISTPLSGCDTNCSTKSEDSGYENGEFQEQYYLNRKIEAETCQNITSSSSSSYSPAPKSSSSGSRVGSAFSDSPLESEEPVSLGPDLLSIQDNIGSSHTPSKKEGSGSITHLEMEISETKSTVNEMERAISDLRTENLRLRLDLGVKNDPESASADESLRSVDEEVQEVTAVRMGKLCRRCLGINDATPGILIDKAMDLMGETLVSELQQYFGSSAMSWVPHIRSSRVWLDAWLAGLCACALFIVLLRRAFDVSSSITYELAETWLTGNADEEIN